MNSENQENYEARDTNDLASLRHYFLEARAVVQPLKRLYTAKTQPNSKSWKSYSNILTQVWKGGPAYFDSIGSKAYYNKVCSAIRACGPYYIDGLIDNYVKKIDQRLLIPPLYVERFAALLMYVSRLCEGGDAYGEGKAFLTDKELEDRYSKLNLLPKLPVGWVGQMFLHALKTRADNRPLITGIALAMNTGARPAEVAVGMKVSRCYEGLRVDIDNEIKQRGAGDRGLGPRWIEMPVNTPSRQYLRGVLNLEKEIMLCGMDEKAFCYMISRLGRELYPTLDETVSPYCIRHQYATDLKAAGWGWGEIATSLGQKTDKCTSIYGRARGKSDGSLVPAKVGADAKPLEKRKEPGPARHSFGLEFGPYSSKP
ncbi:MAG: hypothetical protein ACK5X0_23205 [Rhodospirillales bacterium]|jgi:hypothetical protein